MKKLLFIILLALCIRVLPTGTPPSLNWDEVSHAYTAYLLLHTGADQWGQKFPLVSFRAYGDYPTALNAYLTAGAFGVLGDSDFTARFVHVLYGILLILTLYVLASSLFKNTKVGLFVSLIAAIEPWLVFPGRAIFQSNLALLLFCLAITLFVRKKFGKSLGIFILSLLSYHTTRIVVPFFALGFFVKNKYIYGLTLLIVTGLILLSPSSQARGRWVGLLNPGAIYSIEYSRNNSELPELFSRIIYNRPVYLLTTVARNFVDYFSPHFLIFSGGTQSQFSLPKFGLISPLTYILAIIGFIYSFRQHKIIPLLLALSVIPAVITVDRFAVIRSTLAIPFWFLLAGVGFFYIRKFKLIFSLLIFVSLIWLGSYYYSLFTNYSSTHASDWQYGYKQMVANLTDLQPQYSQIIISKRYGEPHEFYWWYTRTPGSELTVENINWDYHDSWFWVNRFKNIYFVNDWEVVSVSSSSQFQGTNLDVSSPENIPSGKIINTVYYPNQTPAFYLVEL